MQLDSKIYIAGHRGLVGSALWRALEKRGYRNLIGRSRQELDLTDQRAVNRFFEEEQPEYVFLAAAHVGGIMANLKYRGDFIGINLQIQNNVLYAAKESGVKKLLFLGSTCIYPKEARQPIRENELLTAPLEYTNEPYAIAKIAGLKMCESFNLQYGTQFLSVMPTNLYGPGDNFNLETSHVLPALIRKMHLAKAWEEQDWTTIRKDLDKRPIENLDGKAAQAEIERVLTTYGITEGQVEIWGTGTPLREFLWSEDMADACVYVMERVRFEDLTAGMKHEIRNTHINIGTGKELTIKNLCELIAQTTGFAGRIVFNTAKPDGMMRKLTDPTKIHNLGWRHSVEIGEGIQRLYEWYCAEVSDI